MKAENILGARIVRIVREALAEGVEVEIDGLGTFRPTRTQAIRFIPETKPRVFIAYVEEDLRAAKKICRAFRQSGFLPWLDKKKLMPGQNWPRAIEDAIQTSDYFVACFSRRSLSKRGSFQSELRYALACAAKVPLDEIFFIPLRLDACAIPGGISRRIHYVDLFPDWEAGVKRVIAMINAQVQIRRTKRLLLAG